MVEGRSRESIPAGSSSAAWPTCASTTCGGGGSAGTGPWTTTPYGGGAGMVLRPEPVAAALAELRRPDRVVILLDPAGEVFRQAAAHELADATHLVLLCPRYEGVDERIRVDGRPRALDRRLRADGRRARGARRHRRGPAAPARRDRRGLDRRGVVRGGLLEYPQYTRPAEFAGRAVPPVLVSRPPRAGPPVAAARVAAPDARTAAGPARGARHRAPRSRGMLDEVRARTAPTGRPDTRRPPCYPPPSAAAVPARRPRTRDLPQPRLPSTDDKDRTVNVLNEIVQDQLRTDLPEITPGDTVKVAAKVVEGNRERIQVFEGLVMRMRNSGIARRSRSGASHRASASSGRSSSTARGSSRSRSCATARSGAPSCTSCATAWARPRHAPRAPLAGAQARPGPPRPRRPPPGGGRVMSGGHAGPH